MHEEKIIINVLQEAMTPGIINESQEHSRNLQERS